MSDNGHMGLWIQIKDVLDSFLPDWGETIARFGQIRAIEERELGKRWSDDEIHKGLVLAVLSNNTDWSKIEAVLPDLHQLFRHFSLEYYAHIDGREIEKHFVPWFKQRRAGSLTLRKDLTNLIETARKLHAWSKNHGCAEHYFTSLMARSGHDPKNVALALGTAGGEFKLPAFGVPIAAEALKNIGYDVAKPDRHIMRAVGCFDWVNFSKWTDRSGNKAPKANHLEMLETMCAIENFAASVSQRIAFLDNAVWLLCARSGLRFSNQQLAELVAQR